MREGILLEAKNLTKIYGTKYRPFASQSAVFALNNVSLQIRRGATVAVVGRSGSGKSTLARCLVCLETPETGEVWFEGRDLLKLSSGEMKAMRRCFQMVFQHSATALNPLFSAMDAVAEPLRIQQACSAKERPNRALEMIERVRIPPGWAARSTLQFSGGERQRLALARALVLRPQLLILDEALAGLDTTTQGEMIDLLAQLQAELSLSCLFITHDLQTAARVATEALVMDAGRIVEKAGISELFANPQSSAARALVAALPGQLSAGTPASNVL